MGKYYEYLNQRQLSLPKGRNDPCPCGSGKKNKSVVRGIMNKRKLKTAEKKD